MLRFASRTGVFKFSRERRALVRFKVESQ